MADGGLNTGQPNGGRPKAPAFRHRDECALCILFAAVGGLIPAVLISSIPLLAPSAALIPVVTGLVMQGSNLGQVAGPVAVGSAVETYGWTAALAIILISALLAAVVAASARFDDATARQV